MSMYSIFVFIVKGKVPLRLKSIKANMIAIRNTLIGYYFYDKSDKKYHFMGTSNKVSPSEYSGLMKYNSIGADPIYYVEDASLVYFALESEYKKI